MLEFFFCSPSPPWKMREFPRTPSSRSCVLENHEFQVVNLPILVLQEYDEAAMQLMPQEAEPILPITRWTPLLTAGQGVSGIAGRQGKERDCSTVLLVLRFCTRPCPPPPLFLPLVAVSGGNHKVSVTVETHILG